MTKDVTPVEKSTTTANNAETLARRTSEMQAQIRGELSFLSFLEIFAADKYAKPAASVEASDSRDTAPAADKKEAESAKGKKETTPDKAAADDPVTSKPLKADDVKPLERNEIDDMWTLDVRKLSAQDLRIIQNLTQVPYTGVVPVNNLSPSLLEHLPQGSYKSLDVSRTLMETLEKAYRSQRPIRVDLADNASVILRLGRDGRVSAEFVALDRAAELYFRQSIQELRNRLEARQLPYGELLVRQGHEQSRRQKRRDG